MASRDQNSNSATGIGSSPPLVSVSSGQASVIAGIRTTQQQKLTPTQDDHPLIPSSPTSTESYALGMNVELAERNSSERLPALNTPTPPTSAPPSGPFPIQKLPKGPAVATGTITQARTLDDLADNFLSNVEQGIEPILRPLPLPHVSSDLERLRILVERRAWGDVLSLSSSMLRGQSSHYASLYSMLINNPENAFQGLDSQQSEVVEIMSLQCHALLKMRHYNELSQEIAKWKFCHHLGGSTPSWVPWSLHLIAASSLQYSEHSRHLAGEALWNIRSAIPDDQARAQLQAEHMLSNMYIRLKDWRMALSCLDRMLPLLKAAAEEEVSSPDAVVLLEKVNRCHILSRQGRVLLQAGAIDEAADIFQEASSTWHDIPSKSALQNHISVQIMSVQLDVNEGLLRFACAKHEEALSFFYKAMTMFRKDVLVVSNRTYRREDWVGPYSIGVQSPHELYSETVNNMALCALYTCRLHESIKLMESLIREDPPAYLTERIAFNLCTLYELSSDSAVAARKKRTLQQIAKRFFLHDIGPESFRSS